MADISNQWQLAGDCSQCRRKDYCKTECSARKKFRREQAEILINQYLQELYKKNQEAHEGEEVCINEQQEDCVQDAEGDVRPAAEGQEE